MLFGQEFYPTPIHIINEMLSCVNLEKVKTILEPSAGKGDIVDRIRDRLRLLHYGKDIDIDAVEIEPHLRHILKGKGIRVIHDDFLDLASYKRYDLIIMNPPFSCGEKHLLKALDIQSCGGQIVCLLNAETLRNPYSKTRQDLVQQLDQLGASITFLQKAFCAADRKTDVETALVSVKIPVRRKSNILDGLRSGEKISFDGKESNAGAITPGEFVDRIIARYNFELRAGLELIYEYQAMLPVVRRSFKEEGSPILELRVDNESKDLENSFIQQVRLKYWEELFRSDEFSTVLTSQLRTEFFSRIDELKDYDFTLFNILQIRESLSKGLLRSVEETIISLFEELSHKWHWANETSRNIHYYNGWKTNKAWYINKKVILPNMQSWSEYSGALHFDFRVVEKLQDIEKVFMYLDGHLDPDRHKSLRITLHDAESQLITRKIQLKYFTVSFFKKGTCHIEFTDLDLLKKFNLFGSQQKGWLPPSYGHVSYDEMTPDERAVIDSFEGKESYEKVLRNKDYYLGAVKPLALTG